MVQEVQPEELQQLLNSDASVAIIDVRQPEELLLSRLPDAISLPLMNLPHNLSRIDELIQSFDYCVVLCRVGIRSAQAIEYLESQGLRGCVNLSGGINAYAQKVDPNLNVY